MNGTRYHYDHTAAIRPATLRRGWHYMAYGEVVQLMHAGTLVATVKTPAGEGWVPLSALRIYTTR